MRTGLLLALLIIGGCAPVAPVETVVPPTAAPETVSSTETEPAPEAPARPATISSPSGSSDAEIRRKLIARSRAAFHGNCGCPYDTDAAGRRCGGRSAHSRPGGAFVLCFDADVTSEMVAEERLRQP